MTKEILHKPRKTITVTNSKLSLAQKKVYNVILFDARKELLKNPDQNKFYFSISNLKKRSGLKKDNFRLKEDIRKLSNIEVQVLEGEDWSLFKLISAAKKEDQLLRIELPEDIKELLLAGDDYAPINLVILKLLTKKYSVVFYELALKHDFKNNQIPMYSIEDFRKITGTEESKSYNNFHLLKTKVIDPAIEEINDKTDIKLRYEIKTKGKKITHIKLIHIKGRELANFIKENHIKH